MATSFIGIAFTAEITENDRNGNGKRLDAIDEKATFDTDSIPPLSLKLSNWLSFGAKLNVKTDFMDNEDMDHGATDDITRLESNINLAVMVSPYKNIDLIGEAKFIFNTPLEDSQDQEDRIREFELKRGYLLWSDFFIPSLDIQIGRQRLKDKREWLIDEDLDAIKVAYENGPLEFSLSASSNFIDPRPPKDRIMNYMLKMDYNYNKRGRVALYGLVRKDRANKISNPNLREIIMEPDFADLLYDIIFDPDSIDDLSEELMDLAPRRRRDKEFNPVFVGLSLYDKSIKRQKFWLDFAFLFGHERDKRLRSFGFDAGWVSRLKLPMKPSFTLGFAYGSGDSAPKSNHDRDFRQSGLHDNSYKFNGNTKFKYYGEVFDPELSNMMIWTVGLGIKPKKNTSIDLIYHYYAQVEKSDDLRDVGIDPDPTGDDKSLGHAVDLIMGASVGENIKLSFTSGVFIPGKAFAKDEDDISLFGELKFQISF